MKNYKNVVEYLSRIREINQRVELDKLKLENLRSKIQNPSLDLTGSGTHTSQGNGTENALVALLSYEEQLSRDTAALITAQINAEKLINTLPNEQERNILIRHYICGQTYEEIADALNYSIGRIYQLRRQAIENIILNYSCEL